MEAWEMTLRDFSPEDLEACVEIFQRTFAEPPWSENWAAEVVRARMRQMLETPGFRGVVGVDGSGAAIAFAMGVAEPWHEGSHFNLREICVAPEHQRKGLGGRLMAHLQEIVVAEGARRIYLLTARGDLSEAFYQKLGFYTSPKMILMARRTGEEAAP